VVAEESARASFDEVVELIAKRTGAHVPKRQVEELTVRSAQDYDEFYDSRLREPEATSDLLVLSFDGKGIAMRHADLREATRRAAGTTPRRLETRLTSGEKRNRKRMAQVATVYTLAPWVRTAADILHTLRPDDLDAKRPRPTEKAGLGQRRAQAAASGRRCVGRGNAPRSRPPPSLGCAGRRPARADQASAAGGAQVRRRGYDRPVDGHLRPRKSEPAARRG
jgi:hypothetical protein